MTAPTETCPACKGAGQRVNQLTSGEVVNYGTCLMCEGTGTRLAPAVEYSPSGSATNESAPPVASPPDPDAAPSTPPPTGAPSNPATD